MRIVIPSVQVPFITGGATFHINNLKAAIQKHGHQVEIITFPFKFFPENYIEDLMNYCQKQDFTDFNGYSIDKVIALQFPAYYVKHPNKTLWIMHQHRVVYDLYNKVPHTSQLSNLKEKIFYFDNQEFSTHKIIYTNSKNISNRLKKYNNITYTKPLYHPPSNIDRFYNDIPQKYIFYPSRLEELKRQDLLIKAMQYTKTPLIALIAGTGGQYDNYNNLIRKLNLSHKVKLLGYISDKEKYKLYAESLAVVFPPYDEDYGYVTLEAMLSSKPVLTCSDSGGVLEFVEDTRTGFIVPPDPKELAQKIDWFYYNKTKAIDMGLEAKKLYEQKDISWDSVVNTLLGS